MGLVIDSTLPIADERRQFDLAGFLRNRKDTFVISTITAAELLHGCHRTIDQQRKLKRVAYVENFLARAEVIPFSLTDARYHAKIWAEVVQNGTPVGMHDLQIAATALRLGFAVATLNLKDFLKVPGLTVLEEEALAPFRR